MAYCKAAPFPFLSGISLEEGKATPHVDSTLYGQLIGSLIYLTHSRPDICYSMNYVSRYMQQPHDINSRTTKRILQDMQGTRSYGIHYVVDSKLDLVGFIDPDWEGDSIDQNSNYRYVFMFSCGPIFW